MIKIIYKDVVHRLCSKRIWAKNEHNRTVGALYVALPNISVMEADHLYYHRIDSIRAEAKFYASLLDKDYSKLWQVIWKD